MSREQIQQGKVKTFFVTIFIIFVFLLVSPIIILFLLFYFFRGKWLGFLVRQQWHTKGKFLLFVYSNSPNWKEYIEQNILPRISSRAVVINWSERNQWEWKRKLELEVFRHWTLVTRYVERGRKKWFGGEFCPIAIVFNPWWKPKVIRFWQAFKDFKHGKDLSLKRCEKELFEILDKLDHSSSTIANGFSKTKIILTIFLVIIFGFALWLKYNRGNFWAIDRCLDAGRLWNNEKEVCE